MKHAVAPVLVLAAALIAAAQTKVDLGKQGKNVDFSGAASTKPFRSGTQLPANCSLGEAFFKTDAPAGENLYACTAADVWTLQSGANGLPDMPGQDGKVLTVNASAAEWVALGGDLSGTPGAATVSRIQGSPVAAAAPTDGQVLRWSGAQSRWQPFPMPTAQPNYAEPFTNQTVVTIAGTSHGLGTANVLVECYDDATPAARLTPSSVTVDGTSYDVVVTFAAAQSGRCVVNGSGAGSAASTAASNTFAGGTVQTFQGALIASTADRTAPVQTGILLPAACTAGDQYFKSDAEAGRNLYFCTAPDTWTQMTGGHVASVFGRTGAVTPANGDYNFSQISGTVANAQIAAGIDTLKIGLGAVNNTQFGYLSNLSGDVQTQLDSKAAAVHTHTAGGDVTGDIGGASVVGLQGHPVSGTAPADGQALVWNAAASAWEPGDVAQSGGAGMISQLGDFAITRASASVLNIGANCSTTTPCNVRFGNTAYNFTRSCTATVTAGTGTAYVYIASGGTLTIGHNLTVAASAGCLAQGSVTNFPADSIPLYTWTASSGAWDATGGRDFRALLSTKALSAGTGVTTVDSGGRTTVAVDTATVPMYLSAAVTIDFAAIPAGGCSGDQNITVYGASVGDAVAAGWPGGLEAGLVGMMRVSGSNTVAARLCNVSAAAVDPASGTYRATVVKSF